ncbi:MAG: hypothetical protein JO090_10915 [Rhizobacter sp.]|nr:hypothetical protein [Rhizobacter sp.]
MGPVPQRDMGHPRQRQRRATPRADAKRQTDLAIFVLVVVSTFPVVLPFAPMQDVIAFKNASRVIALVMPFSPGLRWADMEASTHGAPGS